MLRGSSAVDRIAHQAGERLAAVREDIGRPEQLEALRRFLRLETERLRMRHRVGLGGDDIATGRSQQVDLAVQRVCQIVAGELPPAAQDELADLTLVALGGYGRGELAPFSDIDILFLHPGAPSEARQLFVERTLALLWDTGFTVGHSYRTVEQCVSIAREDLHSRTALSEARRLTGSVDLFAELERRLEEAVWRSRKETERFVTALREETEARYEKHGHGVGLLEPNVKESAGGLRDLHTILWLGHARFGGRRLEELRDGGQLRPDEYVAVRRARDFLWRLRNEAHFTAGRKCDLLTVDVQADVAPSLGYSSYGGRAASERLMHDYYRRAHGLHHVFEEFAVRNGLHPRRAGFRLRLPLGRGRARFEIHDGALHFARGVAGFGEEGPLPVLAAFDLAQARGVDLSHEVRVSVRAALPEVDARFRASREASRAFMGILGRRGRVAGTLRAMHDTGFLGRFLPEFAPVTFLAQHDGYHRYTVDEHTLQVIEALDGLAHVRERGGPLAGLLKALGETADVAPLYLALLLHDVGKGRRGSHAATGARLAQRVVDRLGLDREQAEDVVFLVREHLRMSLTSQRRDLSEEGLIQTFCAEVSSVRRLNLLLLVTYADNSGVGAGVWTTWKASLLWKLYAEARGRLTGRTVSSEEERRARAHAKIVESLAARFPGSRVERHLAMLPERYLRTAAAEVVGAHLDLVTSLAGRDLAVSWRDIEDGAHTELTVCARDAAGLFARLAGTLTANGLDIMSVDVFTREDGIVLDTFTLSEAPGGRQVAQGRRVAVEGELVQAVSGELDVGAAVEARRASATRRRGRRTPRPAGAPTVRFDSEASPAATVVEVGADDELGLAYRIASTLSALGLDITFAKIASEKSRAWDVFYVTGDAGEKLTPEEQERVAETLRSELGAGIKRGRKENKR